jgi:hypothetical protein
MFKEWAAKQFGDPGSEDEAEVPVHFKKAKDISFERNGSDELILPPMSEYRNVRQKQRVIRAYAGAVYSKPIQPIFLTHLLRDIPGDFTGSSRSAFPYILAAKSDQTIFSPECVPDGFCLSDPDHLPTVKINLLYTHWLKRQDEGLAPLIILNASPLHEMSIQKSKKSKGKAKMEYVDVTSDDEEDGDKEEEEEEQEQEEEQEEEGEAHNEEKEDDHEEEEEKEDEKKEDDEEEESKEDDEENKEDDEENKEDDEDEHKMPPVIKYGPPQGKKNQILSSAQHTTHPAIAGPSTTPPLKHVSKASKAGKASKPPNVQSQVSSIAKTTSNALSVSRPSKTKSSVVMTGPDSNQVLFQLMTSQSNTNIASMCSTRSWRRVMGLAPINHQRRPTPKRGSWNRSSEEMFQQNKSRLMALRNLGEKLQKGQGTITQKL